MYGGSGEQPQRGGLVIVDKPTGLTSHDVVARVRRLAGTRRVGHAGTLDPMATGVLLVGIGRATRLLGHLALHDKDYLATMRLGVVTSTDDAQGEPLAHTPADHLSPADVAAAMKVLTGEIEQRPPAVSAIKVDGVRAYTRARSGEDVVLATRRVTVSRFEATSFQPDTERGVLDVEVQVTCSSGTYIRALARDVGTAVGVGGHLAALRRTRVGAFDLTVAHSLAELEADFAMTPLDEVAASAFVRRDLDADQALALSHGAKLPASGQGVEPVAAFGPDGALVALLEDRGAVARALAVFVG